MISRQQARQEIEKLIQVYRAIPKEERPYLTEANVLHQKKAETRIAELNSADLTLAEGWAVQKKRIEATARYYKATLLRVYDEMPNMTGF